jgi:hypothetical protein
MLARAHGAGSPDIWAPSEPVWPGDEIGKIWQAHSNIAEKQSGLQTWPLSVGEICGSLGESPLADSAPSGPTEGMLRHYCEDKSRLKPFSITVDAGVYPAGLKRPTGTPFEDFDLNWGTNRVDPEIGRQWSKTPSAIKTELSYPISPKSFLHLRLGLRRDLHAWHQDPLGSNVPLSTKEVDLNEPSLGYFHAENDRFAFTLGRFQVHWSPSPDFGLALSQAVPYHNAAEFTLKMPKARYRFLVSSLNPWLEGTPLGDSSGEAYPPGSEEYRQRHYPEGHGSSNFHKRVYAERIKTLFAHRLEGQIGRLGLGLTETQVIGGKVPDLRDAGPFVFFHNDFKDGYTNSALSLDAALDLPLGFSLAGELYLDDVQYADTEGEGNTASLLGYLAAVRHAFAARGWVFMQSLHAIRTDPFLYGYTQPLNTMASRHILASNNQDEGDARFVDKFVVDYPIGYLRGGDAYDFWYRMEAWRGPIRLAFSAALLNQGEVDIATPYENYYQSAHDSPTGTPERELRMGLEGAFRIRRGPEIHCGMSWESIRNEGHIRGKEANRARFSLGSAWSFPR